jgi:1,4-dihydroxy-2-naphthoate octaprenyltransferase
MNFTQRTFTLRASSFQAEQALRTGWIDRSRVVARSLIANSENDSDPEILFEHLDHRPPRPRGLILGLRTVRALSLTATLTPCVSVQLLFISRSLPFDLWRGASALAGVLCLQVAVNLFNDVGDYRRLIDLPGTLGGSGAIQNGWWSPRALNRIAWISFLIAAALGGPLILGSDHALLPVAALGALGTILYSARRFGLKYIAMGDVTVFALCGPLLTYGYAIAIGNRSPKGVLWLGTLFGLLAMGILHVNNLQDIQIDRQRGIETLAIRLGFRNSLRLLAALYAASTFTLAAAVSTKALPPEVLLAIVPIAASALPWLRKIFTALGPESALLAECRVKAAQIHLASGLALILGLAFGIGLAKLTA